mgnify:FL=1
MEHEKKFKIKALGGLEKQTKNKMENKEIVELMLKSSDHNPYIGMLSKKDNFIAAIELAKLCKDFADKGQTDEAMNIPSEQWVVVISELEGMSLNYALIQEPTNEKVGKGENNRHILQEPVKHSLIDIFKELKFGRPAESQKYLQKCIEELERLNSGH